MHRRTWEAKSIALIGIEGLKGKPVAASCTAHQISQSPYDQWRDPCFANAASAFEAHQYTRQEAHLEQEHARLKKLVGALTLELNKSDARLGCHDNGRGRWSSGMTACSPTSGR
jgi:hypothetical protein